MASQAALSNACEMTITHLQTLHSVEVIVDLLKNDGTIALSGELPRTANRREGQAEVLATASSDKSIPDVSVLVLRVITNRVHVIF